MRFAASSLTRSSSGLKSATTNVARPSRETVVRSPVE
jgi:hypothetical protein